MLVWLFGWLGQYYTPFSAVSSLTLRALLAAVTALAFSMIFGSRGIRRLRSILVFGAMGFSALAVSCQLSPLCSKVSSVIPRSHDD